MSWTLQISYTALLHLVDNSCCKLVCFYYLICFDLILIILGFDPAYTIAIWVVLFYLIFLFKYSSSPPLITWFSICVLIHSVTTMSFSTSSSNSFEFDKLLIYATIEEEGSKNFTISQIHTNKRTNQTLRTNFTSSAGRSICSIYSYPYQHMQDYSKYRKYFWVLITIQETIWGQLFVNYEGFYKDQNSNSLPSHEKPKFF